MQGLWYYFMRHVGHVSNYASDHNQLQQLLEGERRLQTSTFCPEPTARLTFSSLVGVIIGRCLIIIS
ncbi:hypothetical protein AVEN_115199-1 [Araneus ventricosus]|uniref:Uncharacterized protein n=1 Tax=Araneus ventricosus TaxID=182803 RepID=A0A4Y1ZY73_ARAVE|nr:hypothetical protein AVEN_115199-1 [Araneus ventricosus]